MDKPKRIQRQRTKGWKMPEGAVYVGRGSKWGNPWTMDGAREAGFDGDDSKLRLMCVGTFRNAMNRRLPAVGLMPDRIYELRGKDLCCWCPLDQPCHADVLIDLANAEPGGGTE